MSGLAIGPEAWIAMGAWALVMVVVVWLLVREPHRAQHDDPAQILRDRFARGEISEAEFKHAIATLDGDAPHPDARVAGHHVARHAPHGQEARHD
jgi:uncharacterized membrane protein